MAQVTSSTRFSVRRIAATAAALIAFAAPSAKAQLITNGGFESGLTDWTLDGYKTTSPFASFVTPNQKHSGNYSMRLTRQDPIYGPGYGTYLYQGPFASSTNTIFTLSFWAKGLGGTGTYLYAWATDGGANFDQVSPMITGTVANWTQYTATFSGYNSNTWVGFQSDNQVEAYFVDDVNLSARVVTATPEPASMALLATGLVGVFGVARRRRKA